MVSSVNLKKKDGKVSDNCLIFTLSTAPSLPGLKGKCYRYQAPKSKFKTIEEYREENIDRKLPYKSIQDLCKQTGMEEYNGWLYRTEWLNENPGLRKRLVEEAKKKEEEMNDLPF
tara:strand:- start:491 stop:835 length:345 start_codon:yes stop_codon:yes gene_type:complete